LHHIIFACVHLFRCLANGMGWKFAHAKEAVCLGSGI